MTSNLSDDDIPIVLHASASKARSGIRGTLLSQSIRVIFSLVSLPIIARQLTPLDYGVFALFLLFITFLDYLRDLGITMAVMGTKNFDEKVRSNVFWISSVGGVVVFVSGFLISGLILEFFSLENYDLELKCLLLVLLFNGISNTYILNLRRILKFNRVITMEIISTSISAIVGITTALSGFGIWALLIQALTLSSLNLILSILYSDWKPISPSKNSGLKNLYANGSYFFAVQYVDLFPQQFPTLMLGKSGNLVDAGNFDRGRNIQSLFHNYIIIPIRQIGIPIVRSRYHSEGILEDSIQKVHRFTLHILFPVYVLAFCQAELIVQILYGDKYAAVAPIFRVLMIAAMIQTSDYIRWWISIILNQGKISLKRSIVSFFVYAACIFPLASSGVLSVARGYVLASFLSMVISFWFFRSIKEIDMLKLLSISLKYLSIYVSFSVGLWFIQQNLLSNLPNLIVILFELSIIVIVALTHLKYSKFYHEFKYILKKLV
jgi:PST family polysaccharide transporter